MISYHSSLYGADNVDDDDQDVWNGRGGSLYGVREPELVSCIPAYSTHTTLHFMIIIIFFIGHRDGDGDGTAYQHTHFILHSIS